MRFRVGDWVQFRNPNLRFVRYIVGIGTTEQGVPAYYSTIVEETGVALGVVPMEVSWIDRNYDPVPPLEAGTA